MNKHSFLAHANRMALLACKLILIITAFLSTESFAQEQTPVDLSVMSGNTTTLGIGQDIQFYVFVSVEAERSANGVVLTVDLPEGVTFSSVSTISANADICSFADNRVTCNMNFRPSKRDSVPFEGYGTQILIRVKPTRTGPITLTANIRANEPDPNLSNNTTSSTFIIVKSRKRVRFF